MRRLLAVFLAMAAVACSSGDNGMIRNDGSSDIGPVDALGLNGDGSGDALSSDASVDASSMMDASLTIPDGAVLLPDGAVLLPDGALWNPDASAVGGDGSAEGDGETSDGGHVCHAADGGCGPTEICGNGLDDNCNGLVDENCVCLPGQSEHCYDGCPNQAGVGVCTYGTQTCPGTGEFGNYTGVCDSSGYPMTVVCGADRDFRCDGMVDEGCTCTAGNMRPCYTGPASTRGVGACTDGVQQCEAGDAGLTSWGPCVGQVLPTAPACDGIDHACNGMPNEGCSCPPGMTETCYDGPAGTAGVGLCHAGMQACVVAGGMAGWGPCVGEVLPAAPTCDGIDRACTGVPNPACGCTAGMTQSCYDGPSGTSGVGLCHGGMQTCVASGSGTAWGACIGEVLPGTAACDGLDHLCNGMPGAGCACTLGTSSTCYDGPSGTAGVGLCHGGTETCVTGPGGAGAVWGPCTGEVVPASNECDGVDRLCNGMPTTGCTCIAGGTRPCYDGAPGTAGVGLCQAGTQTCNTAGTGWSACIGEVLPGPELCDGMDHLCNGMPDTGCACTPGTSQSCYDGPAGTAGVGLCLAGTQNCVPGTGGVGSSWGACTGETLPTPDTCDGVDRMCNGLPYASCVCTPGAIRSCYTGPAGTVGVGLCVAGTQTCTVGASGPAWGAACMGQVVPGPEVCDGLDHLCNGMPNTGCACTPGTSQSCYDGPAGTAGVGVCHAGTQSCVPGTGGVGSSWGACTGEVLPGSITCGGLDEACDGMYATDCPCVPGATRSCYTGPAGTAGVGTCVAGTQTCGTVSGGGSAWGTSCAGQVLPAAPSCDGLDHACTGTLPDCAPTATCPAPVSTMVGVAVSLTGSGSAIAPATVASYTWAVTSAPAGATYSFTSTTANPTMFTANNAGVFTVRLTVTDSLGRTSTCTLLVTVTESSYLGTEFWGVTLSNSQLPSGTTFQYAIAIGNPNTTAVTVTVTGGALTTPTVFTVPAGNTVTETLPWVTALAHNSLTTTTFTPATSSLVAAGAYHITSTAPVSAYQFNPLTYTTGGTHPVYSYTNDASLLLPTVALTGNYIALSHNSFYADGGLVAVVGTSTTPTTVTITLSAATTAGTGVAAGAAGAVQTYTLNQGDVVQLITTYPLPPTCSPTGTACTFQTADPSGTIVAASAPVAVFAGHDCTNMSYPNGSVAACDHLEQQMFPMETWGNQVVVSQLQDRGATENYMVRLMSREDSNTLTFVPASVHAPVTLNRAQFVEFQSAADFQVTATQPILVAQFMEGQNTTPGATVGDPSEVLEVPTPQYRTSYNFVVPSTYTASFINVVGATGAAISLDGTALTATPVTIAGTAWSVWRQSIAAGSHTINTTGTAGFGLKVLGVAPYTSYAYPGGLDLRNLM